jgi:serine/threonine-protein kinase
VIDTVFGQRYRIVRLLGAGGMGSVYEATEAGSAKRVAIKVITAETARNAVLVGRFEREARATMTIDTPHIVRVLDAGTDGPTGLPFLVMEYLEGEDVSHLVKRLGPLPPELALRIVAQACLGLQAAHDARIIHRDIKPANFFLARDASGQRTVKLLDFGIAKISHDPADSKAETAGLTRTGSMLGSPLYMSPEQARGLKEIDRRADVWSMGVVLYQALTGRTPHQDNDALGELIIAICTEEAAPVQELAPWVPPSAAAVAHGAMRFEPTERYQTAAEMLDAIRPELPRGWAIDDSMLTPLPDAERKRVAPRLLTQPDAPPTRASRTANGSRTSPGLGNGVTPLEGFGKTVGQPAVAATTGAGNPNGGGARSTLVAVGAVMALVAGGALAYRLTTPAPAPAQAVMSASTGRAGAAPPGDAPATPTVRLVVLPVGATVEVDDKPVPAADGIVEITGALGSGHKVRVVSGADETTTKVYVTQEGANPAKIVLTPAPSSPGGSSAPRPTGAPKPAAPRPPATTPLGLRPDR